MDTPWTPDQPHTLATGDVISLPLCVKTNWAAEGWEVNILMVTDVTTKGYESIPIWTHREPYADPGGQTGTDPDEADRVLDHGLSRFARRLRDVLAEDR